DALKQMAANSSVVAVLLEPIQGEGGLNTPDDGYLRGVRALCDDNGWLMMLDEVQSGMCRTGRWFAYQHEGIVPDVLALAKGLGNGFPIGTCLAKGKAATVFSAGNHGSTFGGNPLACSVAGAVVDVLDKEEIAQHVEQKGRVLRAALNRSLESLPQFRTLHGKGLMVGIELTRPCTALVKQALDRGLLLSVQAEKVVRLLPPLIIDSDELDQIVDIVTSLVSEH
ncbi:MAG: aminotransferase class III-fold pyridoxal phosphate-dependent enzyme, partial [Gammaproteobacteria bacterium]|nr:aminotransferase class III-fold pyridoxal phosphate-dependent enzyme [Gammaproteobacteria bacterium]